MAYLALLWKARTIEKYRLKYEKEKINSINSDKTELRSTLYQKWTVYHNDSQKRLGKICSDCCPEGSKLANFCSFLKENSGFLLKIVIGIVGGILTYFLYKIFVFQDSAWSVFSWVVGVAIILGVTFSYRVRCLVLLLVPGLFSRVGRYTLACYALVLILTGPAANTLKNLDTLSTSLACGQEQIKSSVKDIKESKGSPLNLVKETMSATVEKIENIATKMKALIVEIHRLTMSIAHVLQSSLSWLNSVETVCNAKLGTPYQHCTQIVAKAAEDYQKNFPEFSSQWDWDLIVRSACFTLKPVHSLCVVGDFAKGSIVATVKKKLNTYSDRIQAIFNMSVHIRRSHSACGNGSLPVSQAAAGIVTDLRNRADTLLAWLSWTCALTGLFLMLIIFRAKYYLLMFRTRSRFDNRYVTKELRELDLKRQRQGRETVLPLNTRERAKYVSTASFRLLPSERMYLTRSIVFMVITTLKLMIHIVADYSLHWVLMNVRFRGNDQRDFQRLPRSNRTRVVVSGSGPLAGGARALSAALVAAAGAGAGVGAAGAAAGAGARGARAACLPDPNPPDLQRYAQIGTLILLLWLLALFEPYGLRLRHVISAHYQPERAKARAVWLYYHIIRTRSCFLKYARRKLHRQYKYTSEEKLTFKKWLHDCIPCSWLRTLLRVGPAEPHCLLCYTKHRQNDLDRHLKRCETPSCPGVYCTRCFTDIGQLCTICYSPEDYGDLSDVSLEKFSSDDSESDVSCDDENIGLMGTRQYEIYQDGSNTLNNKDKKYKVDKFAPKDENYNQESIPLLECNYLKKDYTKQGITQFKYNSNSIQTKNNVPTQVTVSGSEVEKIDHKSENISRNILQSNTTSVTDPGHKMVFGDTEVTVNGVTFPKGKLGAIVKIMMLLTSKDEKYYKCRIDETKRKPFEYLVMEMFQPSVIFQKIISARRNKSATGRSLATQFINESGKTDIHYLFNNPGFSTKFNNSESLMNTVLQKDFNFKNSESILKHIRIDAIDKNKNERFSKRIKQCRYSRRKVKRFLDLKDAITNNLKESLSKSKRYCTKHKFSSKKRRRSKQLYKCVQVIATISNVFSNSFLNYWGLKSSNDKQNLNVEENELSKNSVNRIDPTKNDTGQLKDQINISSQENEGDIKNNVQNLSNIAKRNTLYIKADDGSSGESPSKETDENHGIETDNNLVYKTTEVETHHKKHKKPGFWESLRLRRRRNHSTRLFFSATRDDPSFYNIFANHKRRKKAQVDQTVNKDLPTSNLKDDFQSYSVSFCLKDDELNRKLAKYSGIMDMENNELLLVPDAKIIEEKEPMPEKDNIGDSKQEKSSRWFYEGQMEQTVFKATPTEGEQTDKRKDEESNDRHTNEPSGKLFNLGKKLKTTISQVACSFTRRDKSIRSVVFSDVNYKDSESEKESKPWTYRVESIQDFLNYFPYQNDKCDNEDSLEEETESDNIEVLQHYKCEIEQTDEEESGASYIEMKPLFESDMNRKNEGSCVHKWRVEPKKQEACQTKGSADESSSFDSSQAMVHKCFQVKINPEDKVTRADMSLQTLESAKRNQIGKASNSDIIEENEDFSEHRCKCRASRPWNQQTQTPRDYTVKNLESSWPTYHTAVQSTDIETDNTVTTVPKYLHPTFKPYKGRIIKEVTERLIWPTESICSQVALEYADEKIPKSKSRNVTLTANRSTTTMTKTVADVSTITSDWWSPLLERKSVQTKREVMTEHGVQEGNGLPENKWGSAFYLDDAGGVLSASNYLMQSEQYYAQMYSRDTSSSRSYCLRKRNSLSDKPSFRHNQHLRKGNKNKRLNECYNASWKKLQSSSVNLAPPKWRPVVTEEQAHALKYYRRRNPKKNMNWKSRKLNQEKESCKTSQSNSILGTASIFSSSC